MSATNFPYNKPLTWSNIYRNIKDNMGRDARKPVFGVSVKVSFKPVSQLQKLARKLKFHL